MKISELLNALNNELTGELEEAEKRAPSKHPGLKNVSAKIRSETVKKVKKGEKIGYGRFKDHN